MDKQQAEELANSLMEVYGLDGWTLRLNKNKHLLGLCNYDSRVIELSAPYVLNNTVEHVIDTILHEIAHALAGRTANHGPVWKAQAKKIGAIPKACATDAVMPQGRWQARCSGCAREFHYHRKPTYIRSRYCRKCGPLIGKLVFRDHAIKPGQQIQISFPY